MSRQRPVDRSPSIRRPQRGALLAASVLVIGGLIAPVGATTFAAQPSSTAAVPAPTAQPPGRIALTGLSSGSHTITLITGDTVRLTGVGGKYAVEPVPGVRPDGTQAQLLTTASPDGVYVTPSDALPAINSGRLDRELFNVSYLAENGYADDQTKQLPVIVQYSEQRTDRAVAAAADGLPASKPATTLESINASAVGVARTHAGRFWTAVRAVPDESAADADRTVGLGDVPGTLRAGITKIWLDGKVHASLDQSVPLIGAPQAWQAGFDGTGVKVAILDTGIDDTHPDLQGKVVASQSFIDGQTVQDGFGHGTHVASTVVGSGAASGGQYKGVAPGADLAIGKVLDNSGEGSDSGIIDGMEWAAQTQDADIVSMSLGGGPSDGTDPMSQAVNDLTASTGALFVIAAGNSGPDAGTVSTPGTADAALTVAATDKTDGLASFSSRGPRLDGSLKPDIAAPGVDIVAASANNDDNAICRASPSVCLGNGYMRISGTSMATPHVSGSAAILKQQHPGWEAAQLKAALMSTSHDAGHNVYEQGAGRVDIARAVSQQVYASTPNLDFDTVTEPDETLTRELTYTSVGSQPVTLDLSSVLQSSSGSTVEGALSLADTTLTVPAGGTATTTATLESSQLPDLGNYGGVVTATADGVQLRSPVGVVRDVPKVTLTIHTLGRDGQPATPWGQETLDVSGDKGLLGPTSLTEEGTTVTQVPEGAIVSVAQAIAWIDEGSLQNDAVLLRPELDMTGDTEITLDARDASEVTFSAPKPAKRLDNFSKLAWQRTVANGTPYMSYLDAQPHWRLWASPTEPVTTGRFRFHSRFTLGRAPVAMSVQGARKVPLHPVALARWTGSMEAGSYQPFTGTQTLDVVDVGQGAPEDLAGLDLDGKLALMEAPNILEDTPENRICGVVDRTLIAVREAGAAGVAYYPSPGSNCPIPLYVGAPAWMEPLPTHISNVSLPTREGLALRDLLEDGPVEVQVTGVPESPYSYTFAPYEEGRVPDSLHYTFTKEDLAEVDLDVHLTQNATYHDYRYFTKADDVAPLVTDMVSPVWSIEEQAFDWGQTRTSRRDWIGPLDPEVLSSHGIEGFAGTQYEYDTRLEVFDQPTRTEQTLLATPFTPGAETGSDQVYELAKPGASLSSLYFACNICVRGDALWAGFAMSNGKTGSREFTAGFFNPETFEQNFDLRLYRDGEEVPRTPGLEVLPLFTLPDAAGEYRLTATNDQHDVEWTFSTPIDTEKLDGSACALELLYGSDEPCQPLPVVFVSYDLGDSLATDNTVPAGRTHTFTVSPYHSPSETEMPAIAGLKLWASTDDGATYRPVSVKRNDDGTYTATARYPALKATTGAVTLKVEAWDTEGNTIKQITKRAFDLR